MYFQSIRPSPSLTKSKSFVDPGNVAFLGGEVVNESLLYRTNEVFINGVLLALMLAATEVGFRLGRKLEARAPESIQPQIVTVEAALLGILALLLGFTMSMAVSRFETRKQLVLEEADAIGTSSLRAQLLPDPVGPRSRVYFASMSMFGFNTGMQEVISHGSRISTDKPSVCKPKSGPRQLRMRDKIQIR